MTTVFAHSRTRIKICGLTTREDLACAVSAGADAVGFVMYDKSPRYLNVEQAARLTGNLAPWVTPVVLFVNPSEALVHEVIEHIPSACLQFHADEDNAFCRQFKRPFLKAARMHEGLDLVKFADQFPDAQAILVDALVQEYGGAGHVFDWSWLPAPGVLSKPLILSGGLNAGNVAQAIQTVRPYAVDVSSGVEVDGPGNKGVKSPHKILQFCQAVIGTSLSHP